MCYNFTSKFIFLEAIVQIKLNENESREVLHKLKDRLDDGSITYVSVSDGAYQCTYYSPSGTSVNYKMFDRLGQVILSVEAQSIAVEIFLTEENSKLFDLVRRWMEHVHNRPSLENATARFLSYTS